MLEEEANLREKGRPVDFYKIMKIALVKTQWREFMVCVFTATLSEGVAVFYSYFTGEMIKYISNPLSTASEGALYVIIFISA